MYVCCHVVGLCDIHVKGWSLTLSVCVCVCVCVCVSQVYPWRSVTAVCTQVCQVLMELWAAWLLEDSSSPLAGRPISLPSPQVTYKHTHTHTHTHARTFYSILKPEFLPRVCVVIFSVNYILFFIVVTLEACFKLNLREPQPYHFELNHSNFTFLIFNFVQLGSAPYMLKVHLK